jgi:hypothetical protein
MLATVVLAIAVVWCCVVAAHGPPVARVRLDRFAMRHRLAVTATNGDQIIRYLATTRRWRAVGVITGVGVSIALSLPDNEAEVGFVPILAGWFVGAVIAEARIAHPSHGPRRAAALDRRELARYLPRLHRALIPVAAALCLVVGGATLAAAAQGRDVPVRAAVLTLAAGLAVAGAVLAVQWRALRRPQPLAEPDILLADDAIRSRSVHVLAAAGGVLVLYCVFAQLDLLRSVPGFPAGWWNALRVVAYVAVPLLGWAAGVSSWPVTRRDLPPSAPAVTA